MEKKIFKCIENVFKSMDKSGLLDMPENISEDTVLMGEGEVLDSVAFITFFLDLEQEIGKVLGKEISVSMEDVQAKNLMDNLSIRSLITIVEEKCKA